MKRRAIIAFVLALAALSLMGCPPKPLLREPSDAYSLGPLPLQESDYAREEKVAKADPASPEAARSTYILARRAFEAGKTADLDARLSWFERNQPSSPWLAPALMLRIRLSRESEGALPFLRRMNSAVLRFPADSGLREGCLEFLPSAIAGATVSELDTFVSESPPEGPLLADAMLALGRLRRNKGENEDAIRVLRKLTAQFPDSPMLPEAFAILKELTRQFPVDPGVIGALLPSTGKFSAYGTSVMHGIEMAVADLNSAGHSFKFVAEDTAEDPDKAVSVLERMFRDRHAIALFGPLFSATSLACAAEANSLGIVMMTPSALTSRLTQTGPYVFRVSLTPERQARSMARFAVQKRGLKRFGILSPDTAYGRSLSSAFTNEAILLGATILSESRFPPATSDFTEAIVDLGGADIAGVNEMEEEYRRIAQSELEGFLQKFFAAATAGKPVATNSTVTGEYIPPPISRIACILLTSDPYTVELGNRLHAAALPHKTINVLPPESATGFSRHLTRAEVTSGGQLSGPEELALGELLGQQALQRDAELAVLISVFPEGGTEKYDLLNCSLAMYDTTSAHQTATHRFPARRSLPAKGNRAGIEAIYLPAPGSQVVKIIPQLVYHEMKLPMLGADSWEEDELIRKPEATGGIEAYFTSGFWRAHERAATRSFVERYQELYAAPPDTIAAHAYDGARLLMEAILRSDGTREGLREKLVTFGPFGGATGDFRFGAAREPEKEAFVLKIEGDSIVAVE